MLLTPSMNIYIEKETKCVVAIRLYLVSFYFPFHIHILPRFNNIDIEFFFKIRLMGFRLRHIMYEKF